MSHILINLSSSRNVNYSSFFDRRCSVGFHISRKDYHVMLINNANVTLDQVSLKAVLLLITLTPLSFFHGSCLYFIQWWLTM